MVQNIAAFLPGAGKRIEVGPADKPEPGNGELLLEVRFVVAQPVEYKIQEGIVPIPLTYPAVLGFVFTGVIVQIGPGVTRFKPGDRVLTNGAGPLRNDERFGGFQRYALTTESLTSDIGTVDFEAAASVSTLYTAASAHVLHLGLDKPSSNSEKKDQKVLIWGASSSFGALSTQVAFNAGYTVVGVASERNEAYVKSFGATQFIDRHSPTAARELIELGPYRAVLAAADSAEDQPTIGEVVAAQGGGSFLSTMGLREGVTMPPGVEVKFAQFIDDYLDPKNAEFTKWLWWDYVEDGLRSGKLKSLPTKVVGGLSKVQAALDLLHQGSISGQRLLIDASLD